MLDVVCLERRNPESIGIVCALGQKSLRKALLERDEDARGGAHRGFDWHDAALGFRGLLGALAHLRQKSILHSDIKPDNIVFFDDPRAEAEALFGARLRNLSGAARESWGTNEAILKEVASRRHIWKLVDFGKAEFVASWRTKVSRGLVQSDDTLHVGALRYRAPEVLCGLQPYGHPIDMWGLGVVMFEVATKRMCFGRDCDTPAKVRQRQRELCRVPRGELSDFESSPCGLKDKWENFGTRDWPEAIDNYWGPSGTVVQEMMALLPQDRITPAAALAAEAVYVKVPAAVTLKEKNRLFGISARC